MSVFPISLPLYPVMNATEAVQDLLEKDAKAARDEAFDRSAPRTEAQVSSIARATGDASGPGVQPVVRIAEAPGTLNRLV